MRGQERRRNEASGKVVPAGKARQGDIVLSTPIRRWIFVLGLAALVLLPLFLLLF